MDRNNLFKVLKVEMPKITSLVNSVLASTPPLSLLIWLKSSLKFKANKPVAGKVMAQEHSKSANSKKKISKEEPKSFCT